MNNGNRIILREKKLADAWNDYKWETDPELAHLDAAPVAAIPFSRYLLDYANELHGSLSISHYFAIDTVDGKHIGNCSFYNISKFKREVELGIMIGNREYWDKGYGVDTINALVSHIFSRTNFDRIHLKTLKANNRAQKCFHKCGFTTCGQLARDGYSFILMEIHRNRWQEEQARLKADSGSLAPGSGIPSAAPKS